MHMLIKAIVPAKNKAEAIKKAKNMVFEELFDYYTTFDTAGSETTGKNRWGELPSAVEASTEMGQKLIEKGFASTQESFKENMSKVRQYLSKYTDDELFEGKDQIDGMTSMFRYFAQRSGAYKGPGVFLYDEDGEGITNRDYLNEVLTNPNNGQKVWIVPADVHY